MDRRIEYESWIAVSDSIGTLAERERKRMSVPWRIWEICLSRANNWGHAGFRPGELPRLVFEGTPADLVAARSTLTGEHLAAYVGT
jgi:hypothetical protein